jgi:hypothetical protein
MVVMDLGRSIRGGGDFKGRNPKRHRSPHSQGHKDYTDFRL